MVVDNFLSEPMVERLFKNCTVRHWRSHREATVTALRMTTWGETKVDVWYNDGQFTPNRRMGAYYLWPRHQSDLDDDRVLESSGAASSVAASSGAASSWLPSGAASSCADTSATTAASTCSEEVNVGQGYSAAPAGSPVLHQTEL